MKKSGLIQLFVSAMLLAGVFCWRVISFSRQERRIQQLMEDITAQHVRLLSEIENVVDDWEKLKSDIERDFGQRRKKLADSVRADVDASEKALANSVARLRKLRPDFKEFQVGKYITYGKMGLAGYTISWDTAQTSPEIEFDFKGVQKNVSANIEIFDCHGLFLGRAECVLNAGRRLMLKKVGWFVADLSVQLMEAYASSQQQEYSQQQQFAKDEFAKQQMQQKSKQWQHVATAAQAGKGAVHDKAMDVVSDRNATIDEKFIKNLGPAFVTGTPAYYTLTVMEK